MLTAALAKHLTDTVDGVTYDEHGAPGNVFLDYMPVATPDPAVAIYGRPGLPTDSAKMPGGRPGFQVKVRGPRDDLRTGHDLAWAIYSELDQLDAVTLDEGGVDEVYIVGCDMQQSEPTPIGRDDNERPEWTLNGLCMTNTPTVHRT